MQRRYGLIAGLLLFAALLTLQIVSLVHLGGEFTGPEGATGEKEYHAELRIRMDRDEHRGYIAGSVLGLVAVGLWFGTRPGPAERALRWASVPVALAAASWLCWALVNFGRTDALEASPIGGVLGVLGALSGLVGPIVSGVVLTRKRPPETAIPEAVATRTGFFAAAVFLWTLFFLATSIKYTFAV